MNNEPLFFKPINWLGLWTLYKKEVRRFISIPTQTILSPMITNLLFLFVFQLAIGRLNATVGNLDFITFLVPGLIMMQVIQNAFSSVSSTIVSGKMLGSIYDILSPPLTNGELLFGIISSGITRGIVVGIAGAFAMSFFAEIGLHSLFYLVFFGVFGSMFMALLGFIGGMWAEKWDHMAAVMNYFINPLSFLSGTFYSVHQLPEQIKPIAWFNPFFYLVDGFRFAMTGQSDSNPITGAIVVFSACVILTIITKKLLDIGWKVKS